MHRLDLLLTLRTGNIESLVFLLDAGDFTLDLLDPLVVRLLLALVVLGLELTNFFEFSFLFDLK